MKNKRYVQIAFVLILLLGNFSGVKADALQLVKACNEVGNMFENKPYIKGDAMYCLGLLQGIQKTTLYYSVLFPETRKMGACIPANAKLGELAALIVKYAKQNQNYLNMDDADYARTVLFRVFPCKK